MTIEISIAIAIIGCLIGIAGWLTNRDKNVAQDAKWRGSVDAKLDVIVGIRTDVDRIDRTVSEHGERLSKVEASAAQAHHRIDEIKKGV